MVKFILNKKSLMTFGKWSLALFSLVLLGYLLIQFIPTLALDPPTQTEYVNVSLISPANNSYISSSPANFTYNVTWTGDFDLHNCTLWGNFTGGNATTNFAANVSNHSATVSAPVVNGAINGLNISVSEGVYTWNVYCYNVTLNTGNYSFNNYTTTVDITNPSLSTPYPVNNSYVNTSSVVFNISLSENNIDYSKNVTLYYRRKTAGDSLAWQSQTLICWGNRPSYTCNFSAIDLSTSPVSLGDGDSLQFLYNTTDSVARNGSHGSEGSPLNFTLDTTDPGSPGVVYHIDDGPSDLYDNDTTLVFNWTAASDTTSGVLKYNIYVSENNSAYSLNGTNNSVTGYSFTGVSNNNYTINVTAVDVAGNENFTGTLSNATVIVDTVQPASPSGIYFELSPTNYYDNDTTVVVNWTAASDATSGILQYKIYISLNDTLYSLNGTNNSVTGYSFTGGDGNNFTINVTSVDNAGLENATGSTSNTTLIVDTTEPSSASSIAFVADPSTSYDDDGTLIVNWTAGSDSASGIKEHRIHVSVDGGAYSYNGTNNSATGYSFTGADGKNYSVNITSVNQAWIENKAGATSGTTIIVDTTNPTSPSKVAFETDPTTSYDDDTTVVVNWTAASDTNGILNYKIYISVNNSAYSLNGTNNSATGYSFTAGDGNNYTVNVTANDTAHNENTTGALSNTTIIVDATAPANIATVSPTLANNSYTSNNWVYVNITFSETNPDKCILEWTNSSGIMNITADPTGANGACSWNMTDQPEGLWNYSIYVNDSARHNAKNITFAPFHVTVDLNGPIINETVPANGGYFSNPSSMTFQVKLTEQYKNDTVNVTVYYRKSGIGASYQQNTTTCFGTAPTWTCNITGIDAGVVDGEVIDFIFNTTDSSGRTGANGTDATPLTATVDTDAPAYSGNGTNATVIGKYQPIRFYANWTSEDLDTFIVELSTGTDTWNVTESSTFEGGTWSNYTYPGNSTGDWIAGTQIQWKIYVNDTASNWNATEPTNFSIDNTMPGLANVLDQNVTNASTIGRGTVLEVRAQWTDNIQLDSYLISNSSGGGTWKNKTAESFSGTTANWTNISFDTSVIAAGTNFEIKIYANDTSDNSNVTQNWYYTIDGTVPSMSSNITNVTNTSTIVKGTVINLTANWTDNIGLDKYWCANDSLGSGLVNGTVQDFTATNLSDCIIDTSTYTAGITFNATIYANDTSGNNKIAGLFYWTIDGTVPTYSNKSDSVGGDEEYRPGGVYILNISWTDNLLDGNVSKVLLNFSGSSSNYSVDTTPGVLSLGNSNYSITLTDLGFGNYTYRWYANDTSGNWNNTDIYTLNVTQNTTNPLDIYIANSTGSFANTDVTASAGTSITVNANSTYGNETELKLYMNGSQIANSFTWTNTTAVVYNFTTDIGAGTNYTANSTGPGTIWLTITTDSTAPTVKLYDYRNATAKQSGAELTLNISVSDNTGVTNGDPCNVTINGTIDRNLTYQHSTGWCNGTITLPNIIDDGEYLINITVADNSTSANLGVNDTYYLIIDNTAPILTVNFPLTNDTYNKSSSDTYIWINGTVSDNLQMGTAGTNNVSVNSSSFTLINFTGGNNTEFSIRNSSEITDGYYALRINYTDNATNTGNVTVYFNVDNTAPSAILGLKNSSAGTYQPSATQVIQVQVTDDQTNATITLNYTKFNIQTGSQYEWTTLTLSGTPGPITTYAGTIDITNPYQDDGWIVQYYVTGEDNATNSIASSVGGSDSSPLANITINKYCGNNGTALAYCSYDEGYQGLTTGANNTYHEVHWSTYQLEGASSLSSDYNISTVLNSISGKYSYVYYRNYSSSATPWLSYDPNVAWNLNNLRFGNNTDVVYYINVTDSGVVIRIA